VGLVPGANPTIVSYNASLVKIYNATNGLVRLKNKSSFVCFEKCSRLPTTTLALYVVVYSKVVGSVPGFPLSKINFLSEFDYVRAEEKCLTQLMPNTSGFSNSCLS
jgi:hypothetical protein